MLFLSVPEPTQASLPTAVAIAAHFHATEEQVFCSGVPLTKDIVLTAAHCLTQFDRSWRNAVLVVKTENQHAVSASVKERFIHPKYQEESRNGQIDFDAALLKLETSISELTPTTGKFWPEKSESTHAFLWMRGFSPIRLQKQSTHTAFSSTQSWNRVIDQGTQPYNGKLSIKAEANKLAPCPGDSGAPVWQLGNDMLILRGIVVQGNCQKGEGKFITFTALRQWLVEKLGVLSGMNPMRWVQ